MFRNYALFKQPDDYKLSRDGVFHRKNKIIWASNFAHYDGLALSGTTESINTEHSVSHVWPTLSA
jgi:hypothetical protein